MLDILIQFIDPSVAKGVLKYWLHDDAIAFFPKTL